MRDLSTVFAWAACTSSALAVAEATRLSSSSNNHHSNNAPLNPQSGSMQQQQERQLIIGGHKAPRDRYPYFTDLDHNCGGSLIAPDVILTAGHCLPSHKHAVRPHVGRYSFLEGDMDTSEVLEIVEMARHPKWALQGDDDFRHDFSLLFLDHSSTKQYVRINRDESVPVAQQPLTAMGVGWTSPDWKHPDKANVLREVELYYLPNDECRLSSTADDDEAEFVTYQGRVHADHLCTTGGPHNERDSCNNDSGSPIIIKGETPEEDILVALVSWGESCADPNFPGVNARVSDGLEFITESVCKYSANPPPEFRCNGEIEPTPVATMAPTSSTAGGETTGTLSPTMSPTTTTTTTPMIHHRNVSAALVGAIIVVSVSLYLMYKRITTRNHWGGVTFEWESPLPPPHKSLEKRFSSSSETAYLSQLDSPASFHPSASRVGDGVADRGPPAIVSYQAIEQESSLTV